MKKSVLLFALILSLTLPAAAQQWTNHGTGISAAGVCVVDIAVPSENVVWGILSVFAAGTCGGVVPYYVRTGNGNTWSAGPISLPVDVTPVCITAISSTTAWIAASNIGSNTTGYIYKTTSSGAGWVHQSTAVFNDAVRFIHFFDANEGVAVGDSSIYITTDGGSNWIWNGALPVPSAMIGSGTTIFLLNSYEVLDNTIWLGDTYGYFYKSTDKGNTWNLMPNSISPSAVKGIAFRDQQYGMAVAAQWIGGGSGTSGGSFADYSVFTTDGGVTWQPMAINFSSSNVVNGSAKYDVAYVPGSANTFVVTSEYDPSWAAFSAVTFDGGATWELIDSTEQHTVCVFTSEQNGYSGGYIPDFQSGMFKWGGQLTSFIQESDKMYDMSIYPQPVREELTLYSKSFSGGNILITDISGKIIYNEDAQVQPDQRISIDVHHLLPGLYFVSMIDETGKKSTSKFIKTN